MDKKTITRKDFEQICKRVVASVANDSRLNHSMALLLDVCDWLEIDCEDVVAYSGYADPAAVYYRKIRELVTQHWSQPFDIDEVIRECYLTPTKR